MDRQTRTGEDHPSKRALNRFFGGDRRLAEILTPEEAADVAVGQIIEEINETRERKFDLIVYI